MSEALRLAELLTNLKITVKGRDNAEAMEEAAAELRRLHDENEALRGELAEQARANGMGGEREANLMAEVERKSDAIQRLWKERDELRTLNAGLVEALRRCMTFMQEEAKAYLAWHNDTNTILLAEIAALEEYLNDKG